MTSIATRGRTLARERGEEGILLPWRAGALPFPSLNLLSHLLTRKGGGRERERERERGRGRGEKEGGGNGVFAAWEKGVVGTVRAENREEQVE